MPPWDPIRDDFERDSMFRVYVIPVGLFNVSYPQCVLKALSQQGDPRYQI